jgi:4-amino-4-deoxy-L-arabinose transferase-like glycosyltransferase
VRRRRVDVDLKARTFVLGLLALMVLGAGARVLYVHAVLTHDRLGADSTWYFLQAGAIHDGDGFIDPASLLTHGEKVATAFHPPAYPVLLALEYTFGARSITAFQDLGALAGMGTIALTGVLGLLLGGRRAGLVAAAITALNPMLIAADGSLMSESLYVLLGVGALVVAVLAARSRSMWWWVLLGLLLGLAVLTRQDAVVFAVLLVGPLAWMLAASRRDRVLRGLVALIALGVVVGPWVVRNVVRLDEPSVTTASAATALAGANCDATYYGPKLGLWDYGCIHEERRATETESQWSDHLRRDATHYIRSHPARVPLVVVARVARGLGVYKPGAQAVYEADETRSRKWQLLSFAFSFVLLLAGLIGIVWRSPDRLARWILLAPVIAGWLAIVLSSPITRLRALGEPALAVGAALLVVAFFETRKIDINKETHLTLAKAANGRTHRSRDDEDRSMFEADFAAEPWS